MGPGEGHGRGAGLRAVLPRPPRARELVRGAGLVVRARRDGEGGREPAAPARRVQGRVLPDRCGGDGLHEVLRAVRRLRDRQQPDQAHRAQGGGLVRGRLERADGGARHRRPDHRQGIQGLPVRRRAALQPEGVLRAHAGHEGEDLAALPRAHVRVLGRRPAEDRVRQPQDGRGEAPQGGRDRAQRRVRGPRRALHDGDHAGPGQEAEAEGVGGGDREGRGDLGDRPAAQPDLRQPRRGGAGGAGVQRRLQRASLPEAGGQPRHRLPGGRGRAAQAAARRPLRRRRVGVQPLGQPRLPRRLRQEPLLRPAPLRGPQGRPQGRRVDAVNLPRRRAHRHAPPLPLLRQERVLHRPRAHARRHSSGRSGTTRASGGGPGRSARTAPPWWSASSPGRRSRSRRTTPRSPCSTSRRGTGRSGWSPRAGTRSSASPRRGTGTSRRSWTPTWTSAGQPTGRGRTARGTPAREGTSAAPTTTGTRGLR